MIDLILPAILAFYVAWNLGANDVANSMGTSVGSKAVTLRKAIIIAGILEFAGAVFFGQQVSAKLATGVINTESFIFQPQALLLSMISVLLSCGIWLQIATTFGLPVASSHAIVGAIAGTTFIAAGIQAIDWSTIGTISLGWIITPLISGAIAATFYSTIKHAILDRPNPIEQLDEWIPWLSAILFGTFGIIVLPKIVAKIPLASIPSHDISLGIGAIATFTLTFISWRQLAQTQTIENQQAIANPIEQQLGRFQILSACFVAFAHGSNDVGNCIAPLAAIAYIQRTGSLNTADFSVPLWILVLGAIGIVSGLAVWGKKVISTIGENIIPLQPSAGFCAELATASTILLASRIGLPVSTSHALVGAVVGIGLIQSRGGSVTVRFKTLQEIGLAWVLTLPISAIVGASIFATTRLFFL